jgi:hypothetical protein
MDEDPIHHRPEPARPLAATLLGHDPLSAAGRSGLLLSAPRRTGKSTFLRNDLIPAVEGAGAVAIYVELWADLSADKTRDAADLIAAAIRDALASHTGKLGRSLRALQAIKKAGTQGELAGLKGELEFELETVGQPRGTTLAKAREALQRRVAKPVVLIIDEAKHALPPKEAHLHCLLSRPLGEQHLRWPIQPRANAQRPDGHAVTERVSHVYT